MEQYLVWSLSLIAVALAFTIGLFWGKRSVGPGPKKGTAASPRKVRQQNPPDDEPVRTRM